VTYYLAKLLANVIHEVYTLLLFFGVN